MTKQRQRREVDPAQTEQTLGLRLLSRNQAATLLGKSRRTLQRWWNQRQGPPPIILGSRTPVYDARVIAEWVTKQQMIPPREHRRQRRA